MFTPFAFFQNAVVVAAAPAVFTGYYIGGDFTTYATNTNPYFRVLDSNGYTSSSFNPGTGFNTYVSSVATQSDGKFIVGGAFTTYSGSTSTRIVRLNANGTKDLTFNPGTTGASSDVNTISIQSDGKLIIGGNFTTYSGSGATRIARVNTNGTLDATFNTGTGFNTIVYTTAIQSDGKIIVGGAFTTYSGSSKVGIVRLNTDGTADTGSSWNQGTGFSSNVNSVGIQSDGKVVAVGNFTTYSGSGATRIARLNISGTIDTGSSWNTGTGFNSMPTTLAIQSDGKIVVGGGFTTYSGSTVNYLTRLNVSGTRDTTFNTGTGFDNTVQLVYVQSDGKILVQGAFSNYSGSAANGIIRLNSNGTRDTTFNPNQSINFSNNTSYNSTKQSSNGSILLGGVYTGNRIGYLTFLDPTGSRTTQSLVDSYGFFSSVNTLISQSDGKIVVGGSFTLYSGSSKGYIVRLNTDGTSDTGSSWNIGTGFNSTVNSMATQSDGKILAGGTFTSYSGSTAVRITRLNTNGTLDTTFNIGNGINNAVNALAVQADGKIVAAGAFITVSGSNKNYITRLNTNGSVDTGSTWNQGTGLSSTANILLLQSDQKIIVGGQFGTYSGSTVDGIARLNTDGTKDTGSSWNTGVGFSPVGVFAGALQSDGKIILGGSFTSYSGSASNNTRIIRLNTNGTKDTTFNPGTAGANGTVRSISIEPGTDKIMIGGDFTTYSGSTVNRIARLNTNGSVDTTFQPTGSGFNANVIVILPY